MSAGATVDSLPVPPQFQQYKTVLSGIAPLINQIHTLFVAKSVYLSIDLALYNDVITAITSINTLLTQMIQTSNENKPFSLFPRSYIFHVQRTQLQNCIVFADRTLPRVIDSFAQLETYMGTLLDRISAIIPYVQHHRNNTSIKLSEYVNEATNKQIAQQLQQQIQILNTNIANTYNNIQQLNINSNNLHQYINRLQLQGQQTRELSTAQTQFIDIQNKLEHENNTYQQLQVSFRKIQSDIASTTPYTQTSSSSPVSHVTEEEARDTLFGLEMALTEISNTINMSITTIDKVHTVLASQLTLINPLTPIIFLPYTSGELKTHFNAIIQTQMSAYQQLKNSNTPITKPLEPRLYLEPQFINLFLNLRIPPSFRIEYISDIQDDWERSHWLDSIVPLCTLVCNDFGTTQSILMSLYCYMENLSHDDLCSRIIQRTKSAQLSSSLSFSVSSPSTVGKFTLPSSTQVHTERTLIPIEAEHLVNVPEYILSPPHDVPHPDYTQDDVDLLYKAIITVITHRYALTLWQQTATTVREEIRDSILGKPSPSTTIPKRTITTGIKTTTSSKLNTGNTNLHESQPDVPAGAKSSSIRDAAALKMHAAQHASTRDDMVDTFGVNYGSKSGPLGPAFVPNSYQSMVPVLSTHGTKYNSMVSTCNHDTNPFSGTEIDELDLPDYTHADFSHLKQGYFPLRPRNGIPPKLYHSLYNFQLASVDFVLKRRGRALIADEMGCGKTLQAIGAMCMYRDEWPVLVICPPTLRLNWCKEILTWLSDFISPDNLISIESGSQVLLPTKRGAQQIVVISYTLAVTQQKKLLEHPFGVIICDESHYIKNLSAMRTHALVPLIKKIPRALLLSGTPIVSHPEELYPQLHALKPTIFCHPVMFKHRYDIINKFGDDSRAMRECAKAIDRLHSIIVSEIQQRKPKFKLPKSHTVNPRTLTHYNKYDDPNENILFRNNIHKTDKSLQNMLQSLEEYKEQYNILHINVTNELSFLKELNSLLRDYVMIRRLKKQVTELKDKQRSVVNAYIDTTNTRSTMTRLYTRILNLLPHATTVLQRMTKGDKMFRTGGRISPDDIPTTPESSSEVTNGTDVKKQENDTDSSKFDTRQKRGRPKGKNKYTLDDDDDDNNTNNENKNKNIDIKADPMKMEKGDDNHDNHDEDDEDDEDIKDNGGNNADNDDDIIYTRDDGDIDIEERTMNSLITRLEIAAKSKQRLTGDQQRSIVMLLYQLTGILKIPFIVNYINDLLDNNIKFVLFAHHRAVLDALETTLIHRKVGYFRVDGSVSHVDRQAGVEAFQNDDNVRVALLSITAAGLGLTLTASSVVVFAELYWTPSALIQAEDRCHRVGQHNVVSCYYLLADDSLDTQLWPTIIRKFEANSVTMDGTRDSSLQTTEVLNDDGKMDVTTLVNSIQKQLETRLGVGLKTNIIDPTIQGDNNTNDTSSTSLVTQEKTSKSSKTKKPRPDPTTVGLHLEAMGIKNTSDLYYYWIAVKNKAIREMISLGNKKKKALFNASVTMSNNANYLGIQTKTNLYSQSLSLYNNTNNDDNKKKGKKGKKTKHDDDDDDDIDLADYEDQDYADEDDEEEDDDDMPTTGKTNQKTGKNSKKSAALSASSSTKNKQKGDKWSNIVVDSELTLSDMPESAKLARIERFKYYLYRINYKQLSHHPFGSIPSWSTAHNKLFTYDSFDYPYMLQQRILNEHLGILIALPIKMPSSNPPNKQNTLDNKKTTQVLYISPDHISKTAKQSATSIHTHQIKYTVQSERGTNPNIPPPLVQHTGYVSICPLQQEYMHWPSYHNEVPPDDIDLDLRIEAKRLYKWLNDNPQHEESLQKAYSEYTEIITNVREKQVEQQNADVSLTGASLDSANTSSATTPGSTTTGLSIKSELSQLVESSSEAGREALEDKLLENKALETSLLQALIDKYIPRHEQYKSLPNGLSPIHPLEFFAPFPQGIASLQQQQLRGPSKLPNGIPCERFIIHGPIPSRPYDNPEFKNKIPANNIILRELSPEDLRTIKALEQKNLKQLEMQINLHHQRHAHTQGSNASVLLQSGRAQALGKSAITTNPAAHPTISSSTLAPSGAPTKKLRSNTFGMTASELLSSQFRGANGGNGVPGGGGGGISGLPWSLPPRSSTAFGASSTFGSLGQPSNQPQLRTIPTQPSVSTTTSAPLVPSLHRSSTLSSVKASSERAAHDKLNDDLNSVLDGYDGREDDQFVPPLEQNTTTTTTATKSNQRNVSSTSDKFTAKTTNTAQNKRQLGRYVLNSDEED